MRKRLAWAIVVCFLSVVCFAEEFDFREVTWGMTREEVAEIEDMKKARSTFTFKVPKENLAYNVKIFDYKVSLQYEFKDNRLVAGYYIFKESPKLGQIIPADPLRYYTDQYEELKKVLSQKYGQPTEIEEWTNETFKNMPVSVGDHISKGHMTLKAVWETDRTIIELRCLDLLPLNMELKNKICYFDRDYYEAQQEEEEEPVDLDVF